MCTYVFLRLKGASQLKPQIGNMKPTFYPRRGRAILGSLILTHLLFPTRQEGVVRFEVESTFAMLLHHTLPVSRQRGPPVDPAQYRQSIPPEWSASGSRPVSRQKSPPVDPAQYPVRGVRPSQYPARGVRQWIPAVDPAQYPASGSRLAVSRQSAPVDPAQYPARVVRQWIPPSIPPEWSDKWSAMDPAQYPARRVRQWIPPSFPPEDSTSGSCPVSRRR